MPNIAASRQVRRAMVRKAGRIFRYLEPQYAEALVGQGSLRIGSVASYADLQDAQRDPLDSGVMSNTGSGRINPDSSPSEIEMLKTHGISISGGSTGYYSNNVTIAQVPGYALCCCDIPDNETLISQGKTSVVEITSPFRFAKTVAKAAAESLNDDWLLGKVKYEPRQFMRAERLLPDPFVKDPKYASERETRIFWNVPVKVPHIQIEYPAICEFVRLVRT